MEPPADNLAKSFEPLWIAWKRGAPPPDDKEWQRLQEKFIHAAAIASGRMKSNHDDDAVVFLRRQRPLWVSILRKALDLPHDAVEIPLFRGLRDEEAQQIQLAIMAKQELLMPNGGPVSYTLTEGVARGFARKGHVDGLVYCAYVHVDDVVFIDHEKRWHAEGLIAEDEVVVWHRNSLNLRAVKVVQDFVPVGKVATSSRAAAAARQARTLELRNRHPELYAR